MPNPAFETMKKTTSNSSTSQDSLNSTKEASSHFGALFASRWCVEPISRFEIPEQGMPSQAAYQLIRDELALDGSPVLNLASFVTTFMEPEAEKLIQENLSKNFIDAEEYPMSTEIQNRCVNMIARLFHAPIGDKEQACGSSTVGSSEALILSVLALKRRWQNREKAKGRDIRGVSPNLVMPSNVQVCVEKAARYLDIEERYVYCTREKLCLTPQDAIKLVDEDTIGVICILGSTYTGVYENVKEMNDLLLELERKTGLYVPIHVDAASGGFVAPFACPDLEWDFQLPMVVSINTSGHKYGLCYAGIGWVIWRSKECLPEDLVFHIDYLGSDQASFTLNFSKSAAPIVSQYYMLLRLGRSGYRDVMINIYNNCAYLIEGLNSLGWFDILSTCAPESGLPVIAFKLKEKTVKHRHFDEFDLSQRLRESKWIVPAYRMAKNAQDMALLRVVLREDFSRNRCYLLLHDLSSALGSLKEHDEKAMMVQRLAKKRWSSTLTTIKNGRSRDHQSSTPSIC